MAREVAQHPRAAPAVQPLAVYYPHAAQFLLCGFVQKFLQQFSRGIGVIAVQIKLVLYRERAITHLAQGEPRDAVAQKFARTFFGEKIR